MSTPAVPPFAHMAAARVAVPERFAFARLTEPAFVGGWALGSMGLAPTDLPGVHAGNSLFDGSQVHVAIEGHPGLGLIDYHVGDRDRRRPRICIRVTPGPVIDLPEASCLVAMMAWRAEGTEDARWARLCIAHEAEILLIKGQLEAAHAAATA